MGIPFTSLGPLAAFEAVEALAEEGVVNPINSSGLGSFISNGILNWSYSGAPAIAITGNTANQVSAVQFSLSTPFTISRCTIPEIQVSGGVSSTISFAIYNAAGNLVLESTGFSASNTTTSQSQTFTPVTLPAGVYYFAWSASGTTTQMFGSSVADTPQLFGQAAVTAGSYWRMFIATNTYSSGFPSTLGSPSANLNSESAVIPFVLWEAA